MTNAEAINWIINISADIGKAEHRALWHYEQALDEIREMLESAQPVDEDISVLCKGAISRQDAIDAFDKQNWSLLNIPICKEIRNAAKDTIRALPGVQPEPQWIPVSERLPERGKEVLVTRDYDGREDHNKSCRYVETASCYGEEDDISWYSYSDEYKMTPRAHRVIAWMPLPKPYTEDNT